MSSTLQIPLTPQENMIRNHALLLTIGIFILTPAATILGLTRSRTLNVLSSLCGVAGFILVAMGWSYGRQASDMIDVPHLTTFHQKIGSSALIMGFTELAFILIFYMICWGQLSRLAFMVIGLPIYYMAVSILVVITIHNGLYTEWAAATGGVHAVPESAKTAWLALTIFWPICVLLGLVIKSTCPECCACTDLDDPPKDLGDGLSSHEESLLSV